MPAPTGETGNYAGIDLPKITAGMLKAFVEEGIIKARFFRPTGKTKGEWDISTGATWADAKQEANNRMQKINAEDDEITKSKSQINAVITILKSSNPAIERIRQNIRDAVDTRLKQLDQEDEEHGTSQTDNARDRSGSQGWASTLQEVISGRSTLKTSGGVPEDIINDLKLDAEWIANLMLAKRAGDAIDQRGIFTKNLLSKWEAWQNGLGVVLNDGHKAEVLCAYAPKDSLDKYATEHPYDTAYTAGNTTN